MRKEENAVVASMKAGFTLVELLVVVAILGVLGTIVVQNVNEYLDNAKVTAAQSSVQGLSESVLAYKIKYKKMPTSLTQLVEGDEPIVEGGEGALIDPWDNEYKFELKGKRCVISSAGLDGEWGTEDDISSDKIKKSANK